MKGRIFNKRKSIAIKKFAGGGKKKYHEKYLRDAGVRRISKEMLKSRKEAVIAYKNKLLSENLPFVQH